MTTSGFVVSYAMGASVPAYCLRHSGTRVFAWPRKLEIPGFLSSRRPGMTVEIIGAREPMTVCHLVCHGCFPSSLLSPSFRDTRFRVDPETRDSRVPLFAPPWNDGRVYWCA